MRSMTCRLVTIVAVAAASTLVAAGAAQAATGAGWTAAHQLESNYAFDDYGHTIAVSDLRGDAAAVWPDYDGNVWVAARGAGHAWAAKHLLARGDNGVYGLGIGGRGRAVVVYQDNGVKWAQHQVGGTWVVRVVPNQPTSVLMSFEMSSSGWGVLGYTRNQLAYVRRLTPSGTWQAPVRVSWGTPPPGNQGTGAHNVRAVIDPNGEVAATWVWITKDTQSGDVGSFKRGGLTRSGVRKPIFDEGDTVGGVNFPYDLNQSPSGNAMAFNNSLDARNALIRLDDHVWRTYTIPASSDINGIADVALTDTTASVYWYAFSEGGPFTYWVADYRNGAWTAPRVVVQFAAGDSAGNLLATQTPTRQVVVWSDNKTPDDNSAWKLHVRTVVNGRTFADTVPGYDVTALSAAEDHVVLQYATTYSPSGAPGPLAVRTR